jgi:hypothetical protein
MYGLTNEPPDPRHLLPPIARRALQLALHHAERAVVCLDMASPRLRGVIVPEQVELARRHAAELNQILAIGFRSR